MPNNNVWQWYLEEYPETLYGAMRPQTGSQSFMDYWKGQKGNVWGEYQGALGKQALQGLPPSLNFQGFLGNYPWLQRWQALSPGQRGERRSPFGSLRWDPGRPYTQG